MILACRSPRLARVLAVTLFLSGFSPVLASANRLQGTVNAEYLPPGSAVRATPVIDDEPSGGARVAAIADDGTFQFLDLPPGEWRLEVVIPGGEVAPPAEGIAPVVVVPMSGVLEVDLTVAGIPVDEEEDERPAAVPPTRGGVRPWVTWTSVGVVLGAVLIAAAVRGNGGDDCVPTVSPSNPCP